MKEIKKTKANGFYLFKGRVSADSSFIESVSESRHFSIYVNYYLKHYLQIYDYVINQDGWQMVVKLKSEKEINSAYFQDEPDGIEVWRIISEQIRKCLSSYVVKVNRMRGRTGSLVHSSYERYYFTTLTEAQMEINKIRNRAVEMGQKSKKYSGKKEHYRVTEEDGKGSIYLGSLEGVNQRERVGSLELESFMNTGLTDLVLSNLISFSIKLHSVPKKSKFSTKPQNSS